MPAVYPDISGYWYIGISGYWVEAPPLGLSPFHSIPKGNPTIKPPGACMSRRFLESPAAYMSRRIPQYIYICSSTWSGLPLSFIPGQACHVQILWSQYMCCLLSWTWFTFSRIVRPRVYSTVLLGSRGLLWVCKVGREGPDHWQSQVTQTPDTKHNEFCPIYTHPCLKRSNVALVPPVHTHPPIWPRIYTHPCFEAAPLHVQAIVLRHASLLLGVLPV